MKRTLGLAVFILVGAVTFIAVTQRLYAQESKSLPGYIVVEQEVLDAEAVKKFSACVGPDAKAIQRQGSRPGWQDRCNRGRSSKTHYHFRI